MREGETVAQDGINENTLSLCRDAAVPRTAKNAVRGPAPLQRFSFASGLRHLFPTSVGVRCSARWQSASSANIARRKCAGLVIWLLNMGWIGSRCMFGYWFDDS